MPIHLHRPGASLVIGASILAPDEDCLLAWEDPRSRFVDEDGRELPLDARKEYPGFTWGVYSAGRGLEHVLDPGTTSTWLRVAAYRIGILRVRTWETLAAGGIGKDETLELAAAPFSLRIESGSQVCRVKIRGGEPGFLQNSWAQDATEVTDSRGSRLECIGGWGGRDSSVRDLAAPDADGGAGVLLAFPLEVRLRVPKEYDLERVAFEFRDLPLPLRPGADPGEERGSPGTHRSAWSAERDGIALRLSLPESAVRGDLVEARVGTLLDPRDRLPGAPTPERLVDEDRLRLILRNQESGATVELHRYPEAALSTGRELPGTEDRLPETLVRREWPVRFPLAAAWDVLVPGRWEASATLAFPPDGGATGAPTTMVTTGTIPFVIDEVPAERRNRRRMVAPTALHLRPGTAPGTVEVAFGPRESEVIEVEVRNGFVLGAEYGHGEDGASQYGYFELVDIPDVIDTIGPGEWGPIDRTYWVELYEGHDPTVGDPGARGVFWRRSFHISASASELDALRR